MNCPACERHNDAKRRYCGGCGENLRCVCLACEFENTVEDRFCGGCGIVVSAHVPSAPLVMAPPAKSKPAAAALPTMTATAILPLIPLSPPPAASDEMNALFAAPPVELETQLPDGGIVQSDVDRLFGAMS